MLLSFYVLASIASILCFALAIIWLLAPKQMLSLWGVPYSYPAGLVSRRSAALFLGIAVMFFLARNALPSPGRSALTAGIVVVCFSLAALGILELARKHASIGILTAILVETILGVSFLLKI